MTRISLSGVQPKAGLVLSYNNELVKPQKGERSTYILKPAPVSYALLEKKYCPANEHLTMQLAAQVYGIETAANGICFFNDGDGDYRLTPAYDLINTSIHLHEHRIFALDKGLYKEGMQYSDVRSVGRNDFEEFGRRIGLPERVVNRELDGLHHHIKRLKS